MAATRETVERRPGVHARVRDRFKNLFTFMGHLRKRRTMSREDVAAWFDQVIDDDTLRGCAEKVGVQLPLASEREGTVMDWLKSLDWAQILKIVMQIMSIFMAFMADPEDNIHALDETVSFALDSAGMPQMRGTPPDNRQSFGSINIGSIRASVEAAGFSWEDATEGLKRAIPLMKMFAMMTNTKLDDAGVAGLEAFLAALG